MGTEFYVCSPRSFHFTKIITKIPFLEKFVSLQTYHELLIGGKLNFVGEYNIFTKCETFALVFAQLHIYINIYIYIFYSRCIVMPGSGIKTCRFSLYR